jgi:hypothetical protein
MEREAVARCPECTRFYCRECITEHDHRVLCSECLIKLLQPTTRKKRNMGGLLLPVAFCAMFMVTWVCFYSLAEILLRIPSSFHEGRIELLTEK